jgi:hypothetical protein
MSKIYQFIKYDIQSISGKHGMKPYECFRPLVEELSTGSSGYEVNAILNITGIMNGE